jgi:phage terminase large subunit
MILTKKQTKAIDILDDDETTELLFGGGAGGGKTALGCYWQIKRRLKYPETRGLIGRSSLKTLRDTTLQTFFEIAKNQNLKRGLHFDLTSAQDKERPNCIVFFNGSFIYLRDLFLYPSDPEFDDLGSLEITDAFIDEISQVSQKAKDTVKTRIRYKLSDYNLIPKSLYATNPAKNWGYSEFYLPDKKNTIPIEKKFVQSLAIDNPHISKEYIKSLRALPAGAQKERLLYGNWEYSNDPLTMNEYEKILELYTNNFVPNTGVMYMTCDIAYEGSDIFVIMVWDGLQVIKVITNDKISEVAVPNWINEHRLKYKVPLGNVIYDADGVKRFVRQSASTGTLNGAKEFHNNGSPIDSAYFNLKSECYFKAADYVNTNKIFIKDESFKDQFIQEAEQIRKIEHADDGKLRVEKKSDLKERLKRSPDFWDAFAMRMYFELKPKPRHSAAGTNYNPQR